MTQRQQEEVIANFRSGTINLLVSTTVGEEGIDIPDCKYVIKYDVVGNEIASVQSRGRVRDKEGKYEVVAGKESGVIEKENLNVIREVMMQEAIKDVKAMAQQEYVDKVRVQKKETHKCQKRWNISMVEEFITPPSNSDTRPESLRVFTDRFVFSYILEPFSRGKGSSAAFWAYSKYSIWMKKT